MQKILMAVLIGWGLVVPAYAETVSARSNVFLRAAPDLSSQAVGVLGKGREVTILDAVGEFRRVRMRDGTEGYLRARMIVGLESERTAAQATPEPQQTVEHSIAEAPVALPVLASPTPVAQARRARDAASATTPRLLTDAPAAAVTGPQSPVEQYETPLLEPKEVEVIYPELIADPDADSGQQIMPALKAVSLEFVDKGSTVSSGDFVTLVGESAVGSDQDRLYAQLREVLASYQGLPLTLGDIRFIQQDVTDVYKGLGYPLMSVFVPPQDVTAGRLTVQVNEFNLADYQLQYADSDGAYGPGNAHWSGEARIRRRLDRLKAEPILRQQALDRQVKWINRNPYRSARVVFEPGKELGQSVANVQIEEQKRWGLNAGYNNHATKSSGEHRFSLGGNIGNLPIEDHQLTFNLVSGPDFDEFANYSLVYRIPIHTAQSFTLNGNYSDTASSSIPGVGSASTTLQLSGAFATPLIEREAWSLKGNATLFFKRFERESLFGGQAVGGSQFDAWDLVLSAELNAQQESASNQLTLTLTQSLEGLGGSNTQADFRQFYNRNSGGPEYLFAGLSYARVQQLAPLGAFWEGWSAETQISLQLAQDELAGSDQFAIGGAQVLRAYESSVLAGDGGEYLTQFLNFPTLTTEQLGAAGKLIQSLGLAVFAEVGRTRPDSGPKMSLWDYGLQSKLTLFQKANCTVSLAVAGDSAGTTQRDDLRSFVGCTVSY